jgi:hypothetical protein
MGAWVQGSSFVGKRLSERRREVNGEKQKRIGDSSELNEQCSQQFNSACCTAVPSPKVIGPIGLDNLEGGGGRASPGTLPNNFEEPLGESVPAWPVT